MVDFERKIIFTHPQKCGGTTIEGAFKWHPNYVDLKNNPGYEIFFKNYKHASLTQQIQLVESKGYSHKDFFKFSCVRNPWDLIVSWYFFDKYHGFTAAEAGFEDYVFRRFKHGNILDMTPFFYHNEYYSIEYVIRYENYKKDVQYILDKYEVCWQDDFNIDSRPKNTPYQNIHTPKTKDIVYKNAKLLINYFGYDF
jgi:hypothetical protein